MEIGNPFIGCFDATVENVRQVITKNYNDELGEIFAGVFAYRTI